MGKINVFGFELEEMDNVELSKYFGEEGLNIFTRISSEYNNRLFLLSDFSELYKMPRFAWMIGEPVETHKRIAEEVRFEWSELVDSLYGWGHFLFDESDYDVFIVYSEQFNRSKDLSKVECCMYNGKIYKVV